MGSPPVGWGCGHGACGVPARLLCYDPNIQPKQLLQPFRIVLEAAANHDALQALIVAIMGMAEIFGHLFGIVELGHGGGEVGFAGQEDVFSAAGEVCPVFLGEFGEGEGVPAEGVRVGEISPHSHANRANPDPMQSGGDQRHIP